MIASSAVKLGWNLNYSLWKASMERIDLSAPDYVLEALHWGLYDLSRVHTYSDLNTASWDASVNAEAKLGHGFSAVASYTYLDFEDKAPYLEDLSGNLDIVTAGLRWSF